MADKQPREMRVVDLKDALRKRGLATGGLKAELVKRLEEALQGDQATEKTPVASEKDEVVENEPMSGSGEAKDATAPEDEPVAMGETAEGTNVNGSRKAPQAEKVTEKSGQHAVDNAEPPGSPPQPPEKAHSPRERVGTDSSRKEAELPGSLLKDEKDVSLAEPSADVPENEAAGQGPTDGTMQVQAAPVFKESDKGLDNGPQSDAEAVEAVDYNDAEPSPERQDELQQDKEVDASAKVDADKQAKDIGIDGENRTEEVQKKQLVAPSEWEQGDAHVANAVGSTEMEVDAATGSLKRPEPEKGPGGVGDDSAPVKKRRREEMATEPAGPPAHDGPDARSTEKPLPSTRPAEESKLSNGASRPVPASQRPVTRSLRLDNLVRPFSIPAIKKLLEETGKVDALWLDQIKTHCYVTYTSSAEASATRAALHGVRWPEASTKTLAVDHVPEHDVAAALAQAGHAWRNPDSAMAPLPAEAPPSQAPPAAPIAPSEQQVPQPSPKQPPPVLKEEPPLPTLDDLFKKTTVKPALYWLPLTDEQIAAKAARGKQ